MSTVHLVPPKEPGTQKRGKLFSWFFIPSRKYKEKVVGQEVAYDDIPLSQDVVETALSSLDSDYSDQQKSTLQKTGVSEMTASIPEQKKASTPISREEQEFEEEMQAFQQEAPPVKENPAGPLAVQKEQQEVSGPNVHPDFPGSGIRFVGEEHTARAEEHLSKPVKKFTEEPKPKKQKLSELSQWTVDDNSITEIAPAKKSEFTKEVLD